MAIETHALLLSARNRLTRSDDSRRKDAPARPGGGLEAQQRDPWWGSWGHEPVAPRAEADACRRRSVQSSWTPRLRPRAAHRSMRPHACDRRSSHRIALVIVLAAVQHTADPSASSSEWGPRPASRRQQLPTATDPVSARRFRRSPHARPRTLRSHAAARIETCGPPTQGRAITLATCGRARHAYRRHVAELQRTSTP